MAILKELEQLISTLQYAIYVQKMAAILDVGHLCQLQRKSGDLIGFSIPNYIYIQGLVNKCASLTQLFEKILIYGKILIQGQGSVIFISREANIFENFFTMWTFAQVNREYKNTEVFPEMTILKELEQLILTLQYSIYVQKMAAILDLGHLCIFQIKSGDCNEFSIPNYIYIYMVWFINVHH